MDIELSKKGTSTCKSYKLTAEQLCFADLLAVGWDATDAYYLAFRRGMTWVKKALREDIERLQNMQAVKDRICEVQSVLSQRQKEAVKQTAKKERNAIVDTAMSKEQMLYDLQTAVATMSPGSKEWLDTKKLIVDVTRMKQDEVVNEESTIHHFLPVKYPTGCQDCLYQKCDKCKYKLAYDEGKE